MYTGTDQHIDGVVAKVAAGVDESLLVPGPVSLEEGVLHEEEGPADPRKKASHVLHDGLGALKQNVYNCTIMLQLYMYNYAPLNMCTYTQCKRLPTYIYMYIYEHVHPSHLMPCIITGVYYFT